MSKSNLEERARFVLDQLEELSQTTLVTDKKRHQLSTSLIALSDIWNVSGAGSCVDLFDCFIFVQDLLTSVHFQQQVFDWLIPVCQSCDSTVQWRLTIWLFGLFLEPPLLFESPEKSVAYYRILQCLEHPTTYWVIVPAFSDYFFSADSLFSALENFVIEGNKFADSQNLAKIQWDRSAVWKEINMWV